MRSVARWLLIALTAGCASSVVGTTADVPVVPTDVPDAPLVDAPDAPDVPTVPDVPAVDLPVTGECQRPADCGDPTFASVTWCPTSSWSCIDHQCVWECRGGRRCERAPDGCVRCDDEMREHCPGRDACTPGWPDAAMVEESVCARAWTREPSECFGPWARMRDGTLCSMQSLFTGAPRMVLACRRCQTTIEGIEPLP